MAKAGFKVTNNDKIQFCYKITADYDEKSFSVNSGKPQEMKADFVIEIDKYYTTA